MAEYIEREALLKNISETVLFSVRGGAELPTPEMRGSNKVIDRIKSAPTADVVEVVRCKDCMFSETIKSIIDGGTMRVCHYGVYRQSAPDMHYCSHGHKKMDGKGEGE